MSTPRKSAWSSMTEMDKHATENDAQRAASRKLTNEGRVIRRKQEDESDDQDGNDHYAPSAASSSSASRYAATTSNSSGRSSVEPIPNGSLSSRASELREIRFQLQTWRDKADQAVKVSAQLDDENQLLRYELSLLKEKFEDLSDSHASLQRISNEQKGNLAFKRNEVDQLKRTVDFCRQEIEMRDDLITQHGLVRAGGSGADEIASMTADNSSSSAHSNVIVNGHTNGDHVTKPISMILLSKPLAEKLQALPGSNLEEQINHLFTIRDDLSTQVDKLKISNADERYQRQESRNRQTGRDYKEEMQAQRSLINEYKLKQQSDELQISCLKSDVLRLEGKVRIFDGNVKALEQDKDKSRQELRTCKLQLRESETDLRDLKSQNDLLRRRIENLNRASGAQFARTMRESSVHR